MPIQATARVCSHTAHTTEQRTDGCADVSVNAVRGALDAAAAAAAVLALNDRRQAVIVAHRVCVGELTILRFFSFFCMLLFSSFVFLTWSRFFTIDLDSMSYCALRAPAAVGWTAVSRLIIKQVTGGAERTHPKACLLYTSPSPRDQRGSRMPSSA